MLCFDDFRLDPVRLHVFQNDIQLDASPQVVEVLSHLIVNGERTISRQELLDKFWPRAGTGGDAALNTCIRRIRTLLADDAEVPRYIQTRPRSGYRFIGALVDETVKLPLPPPVSSPPYRHSRVVLGVGGSLLVTLAIGGAVWAHDALFPPQYRVAIEPVQELRDRMLFPNFNVGLRESLLAQMSDSLPPGYHMVPDGKRVDLKARISVRQTAQQTVVVLTLIDNDGGCLVWSGEFAEATDMENDVSMQRALAERMAVSLKRALDKHS